MRYSRVRPLVVLLLLGASVPGFAGEVELKPTRIQPPYAYAGRAYDVLGISPGMPAAEVKAILEREYPGTVSEQVATLSVSRDTVKTESKPTLVSYKAEKPNDSIIVAFGTPATGTRVVGIERRIVYSDSNAAPGLEMTFGQLISKYGAQSQAFTFAPTLTNELIWAYDAKGIASCSSITCPMAEGLLNPGSLSGYQNYVAKGWHLVLSAAIVPHRMVNTRVGSLTVRLSDLDGKLRTLTEALQQLQTANASEIARRPLVPGPKL